MNRTHLAAFVTGGADPDDHAALRTAFTGPEFDRPPGLTMPQSHARTYRLLRHVTKTVGPAADLLADRPRLADLMGWAATRDPALFHAMLLHYCLCLNGIASFSPDPAAALAPVESEGLHGVLLMTEAGRSNSHGAIRTEARFDPAAREFLLHTPDAAAVKFPTSTALPDVPKVALIYARLVVGGTDGGVFTFRLPFGGAHGTPAGMRIAPTPESAAFPSDFAAVAFTGARLPFDAWLNDGAAIDADGRLTDPLGTPEARLRRSMSVGGATWLAILAASAAVARASCAMAFRYSRTRRTADRLASGRVLLDYRSQRFALCTALADACALTAIVNHAKRNQSAANTTDASAWTPWAAVDPLLPLLKTVATDTAARVVRSCRGRCGAPAFVGSPILPAYEQAAEAYRTAGGDNLLIRFDTARGMLSAGHEPPEDDPPMALRSPDDFTRLARSCEHRLGAALAAGVAATGADEFAAWNAHLEPAAEAAGVRAERIALERFADAAAAAAPGVRDMLEHLVVLHGVAWVQRRAASLLRCGLLTAADLDALGESAARICDLVLPDAFDLVDAFDVDEDFSGTFMAADDYLAVFAQRCGFADL